jgi:integration host factor subunit beta
MTKSDLIDALYSEYDITKQEVATVVNVFFDEMSNALANGERVEIRGLCAIWLKNIGNTPEETQKLEGVLR